MNDGVWARGGQNRAFALGAAVIGIASTIFFSGAFIKNIDDRVSALERNWDNFQIEHKSLLSDMSVVKERQAIVLETLKENQRDVKATLKVIEDHIKQSDDKPHGR